MAEDSPRPSKAFHRRYQPNNPFGDQGGRSRNPVAQKWNNPSEADLLNRLAYLEKIVAANGVVQNQGASSSRHQYNRQNTHPHQPPTTMFQQQYRPHNKHGAIPKLTPHEPVLKTENRQPKRPYNKNVERKKVGPGFKFLENLCELEPEKILMSVSANKDFSIRLDQELTGDYLALLLKLLSKVCSSSFIACKVEVIKLFCKNKFIEQLKQFIAVLAVHDEKEKFRNQYFWRNPEEFWNNIYLMSNSVIELIPSTAIEILPQLISITILSIGNIESMQRIVVSEDIKKNFQKLQEKLNICIDEIEKKEKIVVEASSKKIELEPPNNFREIPVYPTSAEVLSLAESFVRENRINCAYKDVEQYLDIQFRLLREDFVRPLRQGIGDYLRQQGKGIDKKIHSVKIHPKVQFICTQNVKAQVGISVQFEFNLKNLKKRFNRLENSKRFMYGSLVCFTRDNFQTLIFGKIIDRDIKFLEKGMIVVELCNHDNVELEVNYVMIECSVYFEPYFHVLNALKNMDVHNFPMERYIISIDPVIRHPQYLTNQSSYVIDKYQVQIFNPSHWPHAKALHLNDTQYEAFKAGLTKEFCIIQGPPGTGKTYLGLKIAKTLIKNHKIWNNQTPILIVCYTNHALDQFLEGLLHKTNKIIRVGGQSKSEKLQTFNINEQRKAMLKSRSECSKLLFDKRNELRMVSKQVSEINAELDSINQFNSVVNFSCFRPVTKEFLQSWFATATAKDIENWLFGGRSKRERDAESRKVKMNELIKMVEKLDSGNDSESEDEFIDAAMEENNMEENMLVLDDLELFIGPVAMLNHMLKVETLDAELKQKVQELSALIVVDEETAAESDKLNDLCCNLEDKLNYLKEVLEMAKSQTWQRPATTDLAHPHNMTAEARWQLYFHWLDLYRNCLKAKLETLGVQYRELNKQYSEIRDIEDLMLMKRMCVVGMTTTGAARLQTTLQALKSRIVIVEEAAEVLESHIITSLTPYCEHLILIGDHQQLRPSCSDYDIETQMKLGISLFERMVMNRLHCSVLGVQHRMRPEISRLIRPAIYPHLIDHESVLTFPPIRGIDHNLYFLHHTHPELEAGDHSKQNEHEAKFIVRLARHLILNGYESEDITILAAYLGQYYMIVKEKQNYSKLLSRVRVAVLDNYQGEECKIILLSLVRNNNNNYIGFLKIENRVCVALSRAKEGMYVMGNMDLLAGHTELWRKIRAVLVEQNSLGEYLTLRCQIHENNITKVRDASDFDNCPEGGCNECCEMVLDCGHTCQMLCHIQNRDHQAYRCKQVCGKLLCENPEHICKKYCYKDCGLCYYKVHRVLRCGHEHMLECHIDITEYKCPTPVLTKLDCGHETNKACHIPTEKFSCPFPCESRLECGHACIRKCHFRDDPDHLVYKCRKNCAKFRAGCTMKKPDHICRRFCCEECEPCIIQVKKGRTVCPHFYTVDCCQNVDELVCQKPCKETLSCGHQCKNKCCDPCGNCKAMVTKVVQFCGHSVQVGCSKEPTRYDCKGKCPLTLRCGHQCEKRCLEECTTNCNVLVDYPLKGVCGHSIQVPCHLLHTGLKADDYNLLKYCRHPCNAQLECKHRCSGNCGECSQGRVHKTCDSKCGVILVCGHECQIPCREACQPCTKPCEYRCKHSRCTKKCGEPCHPCKEPCPRVCKHAKCSAKCGDKCTISPCTEPCLKSLPCGHECIGFCGDPCPPLCRHCDKEELETIFLGFEADEDTRWVLLVECGHVIESQGMDMWLNKKGEEDESEIKVKRCPKCSTRLSSTPRYTNYVKEAMTDIANVKIKFYGMQRDIEAKREELSAQLAMLRIGSSRLRFDSRKLQIAFFNFETRLSPTKMRRRQDINIMTAAVVNSKLELFKELIDIHKGTDLSQSEHRHQVLVQFELILEFITKNEDRLTRQEIIDIQNELARFVRMSQLFKLVEASTFRVAMRNNANLDTMYNDLKAILLGVSAFTQDVDKQVTTMLTTLNEKVKTALIITDTERKQIVRAIGLAAGRWFKCPNGHYYVIGECGGAMQVSTCNECGAKIGGQNHALLGDNQFAGEMDGAQAPAWPTMLNNFDNYDLRDLA